MYESLENLNLDEPVSNSTALLGFTLYMQHMSNIWLYTPSRGKTELHCGLCKTVFHRFTERRVRWSDVAVAANTHTREWLLSDEPYTR